MLYSVSTAPLQDGQLFFSVKPFVISGLGHWPRGFMFWAASMAADGVRCQGCCFFRGHWRWKGQAKLPTSKNHTAQLLDLDLGSHDLRKLRNPFFWALKNGHSPLICRTAGTGYGKWDCGSAEASPRMEDWFSNARRRRDNVRHWLAPVLGNRLYL